jgi:hypothetical protein
VIPRHTLAVRTLAVATFAISALLAACAGGGGSSEFAVEDLPKLVLQPADLPNTFEPFQSGRQTPADQFPGAQSDPERFGRDGGWKVRFRPRRATPDIRGPILVESRADVFDSDGGAEKDVAAYRDRLTEVLTNSGAFAENLTLPQIGDEAVGITFRQAGATTDLRYFAIAWRQANVTAAIVLNGFNGRVFPPQAVALARKQARRIEAART